MGLPARYDKASYDWCLDYKQMGKRCTTKAGIVRDWTKEEMIAYLDWNELEDCRVEEEINVASTGVFTDRRGVGDIWRRVEEQLKVREAEV